MSKVRCIWCSRHDPEAVPEHVFPAALGCPDDFCLVHGEVCTTCNHGLGHLDQAVADDLDVMAFLRGVPRRGGKPPVIHNRRNLIGEVREGRPVIHLNADHRSVEMDDGRILPGRRGSGRDIKSNLHVDTESGKATVSFSAAIGTSPKFVRGLHKIAFSCLAYYLGYERCLDERYNEVRNFVSDGSPAQGLARRVLMVASDPEPFQFQLRSPVGLPDGLREVIPMRLGAPEFIVDLSPGQTHLDRMISECEKQFGGEGWALIPVSDP